MVFRQGIQTLREENDAAHQEIISLIRASCSDLDAKHADLAGRVERIERGAERLSGCGRPQRAVSGRVSCWDGDPAAAQIGGRFERPSVVAATVTPVLKINDLTPDRFLLP